jgi:imidazolonepropionase-like amidohydrolase
VAFCFASGGDPSNVRNLAHHAAMAVAHGLDRQAALEAMTIVPARLFGVEQRLGSIETGKDANLILTDGDPLEIRTRVVGEWIGGQPVDLRDKHTELYELWRSRPTPTSNANPGTPVAPRR